MSEHVSKKISFIQCALCILVAFGHSISLDTSFKTGSFLTKGIFYSEYVLLVLSGMAVPTFFIISGYLFFVNVKSFKFEDYKGKMKKRVVSLLIPYLIWSLLGLVVTDIIKISSPISVWDFLYRMLLSVDNGPLWYIRNLLLYCVLSPLVFFLLRGKIRGAITIVALIIINAIFVEHLTYNSYLYCIVYFSFGSYFALNWKEIVIGYSSRPEKIVLVALSVIAFILAVKTPILSTNNGRLLINSIWGVSLFRLLDFRKFDRIKKSKQLFLCIYGTQYYLFNSKLEKFSGWGSGSKSYSCVFISDYCHCAITLVDLLHEKILQTFVYSFRWKIIDLRGLYV